MDLRDYFRTIVKRWRIVAACFLVGICLASVATLTATPVYQAEAQLFVSVQTGSDDASAANQGNNFAQQRVTSYAAIVSSPLVLEPVIADLGLTDGAAGLSGRVTASVPLNTNLLNVVVTDTDPARAAQVANAVSSQFARVIADLEKPADTGRSLVKVTVVRQAGVPTAPIEPRAALNLALGGLLGLMLGVGLAVLRETLDTTVKSSDDIARIDTAEGVSILGGIAHDSDAAKRPLIVQADPHSTRAEAFRQLRTNLQFVDIDNPPRSIVITSSLPGEGKSTTAANLALTLAQAGLRVALVEADLRRPKVSAYLGLENAVGLTSVLIGRARVSDLLQQWGHLPLNVLPSGPTAPNPSELLGSHHMRAVIEELETTHDVVLLDAPPLLPVTDAAVLSALAGGALVVVRVGRTRREQLGRAIDNLRAVDARVLGVVLNMTPSRNRAYGYENYGSYAPEPTGTNAGDVLPRRRSRSNR